MDNMCTMHQMIYTLKGISWSIKRRVDVSIGVSAFSDMDLLPDFDGVVAHQYLLAPKKIHLTRMKFCRTFLILSKRCHANSMQHLSS
jgi:hypothetical protein